MAQHFEHQVIEANGIASFVVSADEIGQCSHADRNAFLMSRSLTYEERTSTSPFDRRYRDAVVERWKTIADRPEYTVLLEHDPNISADEHQLQNLYPFSSGDTRFIAEYWLGVYFTLKLLADIPVKSIVEYGVGWGNTTSALLQAGFEVLAVDIEVKWLKLLELRSAKAGLGAKLTTLHGVFGDLPSNSERFGAALFFESFHHGLDHDAALKQIVAKLADDGVVIFAGENIHQGFPVEWGVRLDGHSVWAIRRFGWMELGFNEDYFIRLARRHGLSLTKHVCAEAGAIGVVYKGTNDRRGYCLAHSLLTSNESGFHPAEGDARVHTRFTTGNAMFELPNVEAPFVTVELKNWLAVPLSCKLSIDGELVWSESIAPFSSRFPVIASRPNTYVTLVNITSDVHRPSELGMNNDQRPLGVAVGCVTPRTTNVPNLMTSC